jgi:hypothetical protein
MSEPISGFSSLLLASKGREVRDPANATTVNSAPTFVTRTIPDVDDNTRIIAVCGTTDDSVQLLIEDWDAPAGAPDKFRTTGLADPIADGWFLSDFYAFKHLLHGTGASQMWITAESPRDLVEKYTMYLHGNPYYERKVVLNEDILERGITENIFVVERTSLLSTFKAKLKDEAEAAKFAKQSLLVLIFGHGHEETKGIMLGSGSEDNLFHMRDFKEAVGKQVRTTLVTTACFSGGWVVNKDLNISKMAAAGPFDESQSWTASASCGRYCGSIYLSALLKAWATESELAEADEDKTAATSTPQQQKTFAAFTESVYDTLFKIDKFANTHDIRFGAQDDDWASAWGERTGMPLVNFQGRWESLPTLPTTANPESGLNRDPSTVTAKDDIESRTGSLRVRFGSVNNATKHVQLVAKMYLNSKPGSDNVASNTALHGFIRKLLEGKLKTEGQGLEMLYWQLEYRMGLMAIATQLLHAAEIALPQKLACDEFDVEEFDLNMRNNPDDLRARKYVMARDKIFTTVLPDPNGTMQGMRWNKPHRYIAAAIALDTNITSPNILGAAVRRLEQGTIPMYHTLTSISANQHL